MTSHLEEDGKRLGDDKAHGWIQWKGTNACIDLYCECGAHMYFDGDFLYFFRCPHCNRHYEMGSHIAVYELTTEEIKEHADRFKEPERDETL